VKLTNQNSYSPQPKGSAIRYIGRHLRETYATFLVTVERGVLRQRALKVDPQALLKIPFTVTAPQKVRVGLPFP
jgi:hypothetical protein